VTQTADDMRRLAGKFVLFFAGCWLLVVFGAVLGLTRGDSFPPLNWIFILLPGTAFVPAVYFAVKLHLIKDPALLRAWWPKTLVYGGAGLVLLFGGAYALFQSGNGGGA
jgi:hypothetical protein